MSFSLALLLQSAKIEILSSVPKSMPVPSQLERDYKLGRQTAEIG